MAHLELVARTALALIFGASLSSKISSRRSFAAFVQAVEVLGNKRLRPPVVWAAVVAGAEALCVLLSALPTRLGLRPLAFALPACLLVVFTAAIVTSTRNGVRQPCRCFGSSSRAADGVTIGRNFGMVAICGIGLTTHLLHREQSASGTNAVSLAAGLLVGVAVLSSETIADLWRPSVESSRLQPGART